MNKRFLLSLLPLAMAIATAVVATAESPGTAGPVSQVRVRGVSFDLVRVPAGEFQMGSDREGEGPRHKVNIRSFDLGKTEVTVGLFRAFVGATGYRTEAEKEGSAWVAHLGDPAVNSHSREFWTTEKGITWRNPGFVQNSDHPVVAVSWVDATEFCKWLSQETGDTFRLPSEAEWEYAARADETSENPSALNELAWSRENSEAHTHPVAGKKPNSWGLHDMLGNAWEWVADTWSTSYTGAPVDGTPRTDGGTAFANFAAGEGRALRGSAWAMESTELRYAARPAFGLHQRCNNSGFRIARSVR